MQCVVGLPASFVDLESALKHMQIDVVLNTIVSYICAIDLACGVTSTKLMRISVVYDAGLWDRR